MERLPVLHNFERTLADGVVRLESNNLVFLREPTPSETQSLLTFLTLAHDASLFWWGAVLNKVRKQRSDEYKAQATPEWIAERIEKARNQGKEFNLDKEAVALGRDFAQEAAGNSSDADTLIEAMHVCESLGQSRFKLSWHHHREAVAECGKANGKAAAEWLQKAEENSWTPSEMRAAIRKANATDTRPSDGIRTMTITTELRRLTSRVKDVVDARPIDGWSLEETSAFMQDADAFLKVVGEVRARFKWFQSEII